MKMSTFTKNQVRDSFQLSTNNERLFIAVPDLAPDCYYSWQDKRDDFQDNFPKTDRWLMDCYNMPNQTDIMLAMYNELLDGHGVEGIRIEGEHIDNYYYDSIGSYVNMGDTYDLTVIHDNTTDEFLITSWGDFYESYEIENSD